MTLPNFIVIGVAKAGTTSLFRYLDQHPEIFMCPIKGTNFFGYEDARNWQWHDEGAAPHLRHFHAKTLDEFEAMFAGASNEKIIGEVSPQYIRCPTAAERIRQHIPDVQLAVSLRNPVDRAFSGFLMRTRRGEAVKSISEELTMDSSHIKESFYYGRLKRYFDNFPKSQIKVYIFEEFKKDPSTIIGNLFNYLGVNSYFMPDTSVRHNPGAVPRFRWLNKLFYHPTLMRVSNAALPENLKILAKQVRSRNLQKSPKLPPGLREKLTGFYREDILKLQDLIERDLSIWLNPV